MRVEWKVYLCHQKRMATVADSVNGRRSLSCVTHKWPFDDLASDWGSPLYCTILSKLWILVRKQEQTNEWEWAAAWSGNMYWNHVTITVLNLSAPYARWLLPEKKGPRPWFLSLHTRAYLQLSSKNSGAILPSCYMQNLAHSASDV